MFALLFVFNQLESQKVSQRNWDTIEDTFRRRWDALSAIVASTEWRNGPHSPHIHSNDVLDFKGGYVSCHRPLRTA